MTDDQALSDVSGGRVKRYESPGFAALNTDTDTYFLMTKIEGILKTASCAIDAQIHHSFNQDFPQRFADDHPRVFQ